MSRWLNARVSMCAELPQVLAVHNELLYYKGVDEHAGPLTKCAMVLP
jgi:hypothetical protein